MRPKAARTRSRPTWRVPHASGPALVSKTQSSAMKRISASTSWRFQSSKNASRSLVVMGRSPPCVRIVTQRRRVNSRYNWSLLARDTMYSVAARSAPIHLCAHVPSHDMWAGVTGNSALQWPCNAEPGRNIPSDTTARRATMSTITTKDGTQIYYKDGGKGQPVVLSHGWPLSGDAWDDQMFFLGTHGYRVIAHDRRGHGRSSQPWDGNDLNTYADDLAALVEALDLHDAIHVGHSTGGGEVARYIARHGTRRVAKAVLIAAVPPIMLKTATNPEGLPIEVFDKLRSAIAQDRSQFYKDLAIQFYGANRPGAKVSQGILDQFWLWSMQAGLKNAYESIKAFSETDFTEDLKKFDVPTLVLHGEDDQIVPVKDSARKSAKLIKGAKEIYYPGAPHGLTATHQDQVNADLLAFIRL